MGTRGRGIKEYKDVTKYGENKDNSERMKYLNQKHNDAANFLKSVELLIGNKTNEAMTAANKIGDSTSFILEWDFSSLLNLFHSSKKICLSLFLPSVVLANISLACDFVVILLLLFDKSIVGLV